MFLDVSLRCHWCSYDGRCGWVGKLPVMTLVTGSSYVSNLQFLMYFKSGPWNKKDGMPSPPSSVAEWKIAFEQL